MKESAQEKNGREPARIGAETIGKLDACDAFNRALGGIASFAEILIATGAEKAIRADDLQLHVGVVLEALSRDAKTVFEQTVGRC